MFPFSVILKSILKSLMLNLNYCRHSVSHTTNRPGGTTLCALCPKQKSGLKCCVAIFYFCFQIFYEIYKEFLVHLIVRLIWQ